MYVSQLPLPAHGWPGGYVGVVLEPELAPGFVPVAPLEVEPLAPDDVDDEVDVPGALPVPPEHAGAAAATSPNRATQVNGSRAITQNHSSPRATATKTV